VSNTRFFGSTVERFKDERSSGAPGPGTYAARQRVVLHSDWSGADRFTDPKAAALPGPGAYQPTTSDGKTTGPTGTASLLGSTGRAAFGSMESKRGFGNMGGEAPGPGTYDPPTDFEDEGKADDGRRRSVRQPLSAFKSATHRDQVHREKVRAAECQPSPGAYSPVHIQEVGAVMRVPPKGEGFLSGGARDTNLGKSASEPGPGTYKTDPWDVTGGKRAGTFNRTAVEGAPESGKPRGLGFESQAKRFVKEKESAKQPGPGAYSIPADWTKKNYNVMFGDI